MFKSISKLASLKEGRSDAGDGDGRVVQQLLKSDKCNAGIEFGLAGRSSSLVNVLILLLLPVQ